MQCVSYKQICYQAVNTKVMGLLVLISVFISLHCIRIFSPAADLGHIFTACIRQGSCCFLQALCRGDCFPPTSLSSSLHQWQSCWVLTGVTMLGCPWGWRRSRRASTAWLKSSSTPWNWDYWFLLVEGISEVLPGTERPRTLREDNPSPQILLNGEGAAISG